MFPYLLFYVAEYLFKHCHPNVCIPVNFAAGVLPGEPSNVAEITEEAMEFLAPIFEVPIAEETMKTPT